MRKSENKHDLQYRLSKTVLLAAEKQRKSLFERLTANNAEMVERLMQEAPVFFKREQGTKQEIDLDPTIQDALPPEFFEDPTGFIESQDFVVRGIEADAHPDHDSYMPKGESVQELWQHAYDITRVREFVVKLGGKEVTLVSKRVDKKNKREYEKSKEAYEVGIPTPKALGRVEDSGNEYIFFEKIDGISLFNALNNRALVKRSEKILSAFDAKYVRVGKDMVQVFKECTIECDPDVQAELQLVFDRQHKAKLKNEFIGFAGAVNRIREVPKLDWPLIHKHIQTLFGYLKKIMPAAQCFFDEKSMQALCDETNELAGVNILQLNRDNLELSESVMKSIAEYNPSLTFKEGRGVDFWKKIIQKIDLGDKEIRLCRGMLVDLILKQEFGFIPKEEKERIRTMCKEKGLVHKDFADRNFVVHWDFENDRPKKPEKDEPSIYIIDWE